MKDITKAKRVQIEKTENGFRGYGLYIQAKGTEGRREFQGPMVPGPWVDFYGLAGVISNDRRGTGWEIEQEKAAGTFFSLERGEEVLVDGVVYTVTVDPRGYPSLLPNDLSVKL